MKNIVKTLSILLVLISFQGFSQGESWRWYFGYTAGVNFPSAGAPVAMTNGLVNTLEGNATISDAAGNLLFYTDGSTVWNKLHAVMTNGNGLMGNGSSTQSGVIIPKPGNPNNYYIFTCNLAGSGYRYSEVDMLASAGNGSVIAGNKNTLVNINNTEKCCAVKHCNGVDYWIITHGLNNNTFRCYLVTSAGINLTPVVSNVGTNQASPGIGYLKSSFDGKKLAYAVYISGWCEILDFNNSTGVITNPITITGAQYASEYGVEFSPDNSKVYFGSYSTRNITQVNLCAGTNAQIIASAQTIGTSVNAVGALQLGPDGKIWVSRSGAPWLGVINNPNVLGVGCGYVDAGVTLAGKNAGAGLPNFISSTFQPTLAITSTVNCLNVNFTSPTLNVTSCNNSANAITAYAWNFGDPSSGPANTSALANPSHAFSGTGTYSVNLVLTIPCGTIAVNHTVSVISCSPVVNVLSPTICSGNCALLTATASGGTGPYTYTWSPNIGAGAGPHNICPNVTTIYTISITDAMNVTASNTVAFVVNPTPTMVVASSSPTMCMNNFNGSTNTLTINANGATTYTWIGITGVTTNTTAGSSMTLTALPPFVAGTGSVIGTIGSCTSMATFTVGAIPNPVIAVSSASMCSGTSAVLTASNASTYAWSPFNTLSASTGSSVIANPANTAVYSVIGSSLNCNSTTETGTVTVVINPTVNIVSPSPTICAGTSIGLTAFGANTYSWSPGSTLDNTTNNVVIATPLVSTNYTVVGTSNSCTHTAVKQVIVIDLPTLQAVCDKPIICYGDHTTINANGASSYAWSPATGLSNSTSNFVTVNPAVSTVYTLMASNGLCFGSIMVPITVIPGPKLNISTSNQKICFGNSTTLFASGADNYQFVPAVNNINANTALVTPSATTNYTITGYNTAGTVVCSFAKEIEIEVVPVIIPTISNSVTICEGESVKLNAGGSNTYMWYPATGLSSTLTAQTYANPKVTTVYSVQVSNGKNCPVTATVLIKVNPLPTVDAGPDVTYNLDEPMFLNAKGTGQLTWILGEGIICKDCPNTQIKPTNSGCYQIQAINEFGCKVIDEVCIDVSKDYNIYIPNVFTPNADGNNDLFLVYGTGITKLEVIVFDRWGEKLFTSNEQLKGWDGKYKGVDLKEDVYPYQVIFNTLDGKKHTKTGHVTLLK